MPLSTWLTFFLASWAISFSPGAGAISAMSSGLKYGFARGYWNTAGLIMGILFQFVVVAVGLGAVLATSEMAFNVVKYLGVAYLIYLGVRQIRTDAAPVAVDAGDPKQASIRELVMRGFLINTMNPKGTVFLLAVVPQFVDPALALTPHSALAHSEYARALNMHDGKKKLAEALALYELAAECVALDAKERLEVEAAIDELKE